MSQYAQSGQGESGTSLGSALDPETRAKLDALFGKGEN